MAQPLTKSEAEGIMATMMSAGSVQLHFQHDAGVFELEDQISAGLPSTFCATGYGLLTGCLR